MKNLFLKSCCDFRKNLDVWLSLPFGSSQGQVKAFTLIVCNVITYLPKEYYDKKMVENLTSYTEVSTTAISFKFHWISCM